MASRRQGHSADEAPIGLFQRTGRKAFSGRGPRGASEGTSRGGFSEGLGCAGWVGFAVALFVAGWAIESPAEDTVQSAATPVPGVQLERLMDRLASGPGMRVAFRESRHLTVLSDPIHSEGLLFFSPPGDLARYTLRPARSSVIVREDRVFLEDATGSQSFDLASSEVARGLVGNFGVLLRGDLEELRRRYVLDFRGSVDSWTLELRPRSRSLQHLIQRIEVKGRETELTRMVTFETNGDRTVLVFENAVPLSEVDKADRNRIFHPDFPGSLP